MAQSPCFTPLANSLLLAIPFPFTYLETLLGVMRSRPPWPQVTCKLTSPFLSPPHSEFLTPWGFPELNMRLTKTTSRIRLARSGTVTPSSITKPCVRYSCVDYTRTDLLKSGSCTELSGNWAENGITMFSILPATAYIDLVNVFDILSHCA